MIPRSIHRMSRREIQGIWNRVLCLGLPSEERTCCFTTPNDAIRLIREVMRLRNILHRAYRGDFDALNKEGYKLNGTRALEDGFLDEVCELWDTLAVLEQKEAV